MNQSVLLAFTVTFFIVYTVVSAEVCTINDDCVATRCASGFHVICEHPPGTGVTKNGGLCTCAADNFACTTRDDCQPIVIWCISIHIHCYDGLCICSNWR